MGFFAKVTLSFSAGFALITIFLFYALSAIKDMSPPDISQIERRYDPDFDQLMTPFGESDEDRLRIWAMLVAAEFLNSKNLESEEKYIQALSPYFSKDMAHYEIQKAWVKLDYELRGKAGNYFVNFNGPGLLTPFVLKKEKSGEYWLYEVPVTGTIVDEVFGEKRNLPLKDYFVFVIQIENNRPYIRHVYYL